MLTNYTIGILSGLLWLAFACSPEETENGEYTGEEPSQERAIGGEKEYLPVAGEVVIHELLYEAVPSEAEYIELCNRSDKWILISALRLAKRNVQGEIVSVKRITEAETWLAPGALLWVSPVPAVVLKAYSYHDKTNCFVVDTKLAYADGGGTVAVLNAEGEILDELVYGKFLHHPLVKVTKGIALERTAKDGWISAGGDGNSGYGSPGKPNRAEILPDSAGDFIFRCSPEVFFPAGKGRSQKLTIAVGWRNTPFVVSLSVYDIRGKLIQKPADAALVGEFRRFFWDGKDKRGKWVQAGIYIVSAELINSSGEHKVCRQTCVVSR